MRILLNIDVPALDPAIAFYSAALGLRLQRVLDDDVAELVGAACTIYLLRHPAGSPAVHGLAIARDYARHWTPVHMDFVVDDVFEAARRALDAGAKQETGWVEWRGSRCITFSDPFGHGFCLIEFADETYASDA
ncbi:VOC family protein [Ramlibacter monticola]|uniref:VOC family protein n=1 Tax=Ramlibacter monticola TaxID=1926872 RepID=A0A936YV97_9BURK|nr:VOC family protein [Ramlibacter monticola]MBL0390413.1 VOC family protein [Ramlibacter monticola]